MRAFVESLLAHRGPAIKASDSISLTHAQSVGPGVAALVGGKCDALFYVMLDKENWKTVFDAYAGRPSSALDLACHLMEIRKAVERGNKGKAEALAAIDLALAELYEHTSFNKAGRKFYQLWIAGRLNTKHENKLRELGVKF